MTVPACTCGSFVLDRHSFRDDLSWREHALSGLCQPCQDVVFIALRDDDVRPRRYQLRTGALVAAGVREHRARLALIPFVFGAPGRPVGWEAGSIVYAGPALSGAQLTARLAPMRSFLGRYSVRICSVRDLGVIALPSCYGRCAVVIARDRATLLAAGSVSREVARAEHVPLEPLLRAHGGFGSLDASVSRTGIDVGYRAGIDPLRVCAWLGAALELGRPDPGLFEHVLAPFRLPASGSRAPVTDAP